MSVEPRYEIHRELDYWFVGQPDRAGNLRVLFKGESRIEVDEWLAARRNEARGAVKLQDWMVPWSCHDPKWRPPRNGYVEVPTPFDELVGRDYAPVALDRRVRCRHMDCRLHRLPDGRYCDLHRPRPTVWLPPLPPYRVRLKQAKRRAKRLGIKFGSFYKRGFAGQRRIEVWNEVRRELESMLTFDWAAVDGDYRNGGLGVTGCRRIQRGHPEFDWDAMGRDP